MVIGPQSFDPTYNNGSLVNILLFTLEENLLRIQEDIHKTGDSGLKNKLKEVKKELDKDIITLTRILTEQRNTMLSEYNKRIKALEKLKAPINFQNVIDNVNDDSIFSEVSRSNQETIQVIAHKNYLVSQSTKKDFIGNGNFGFVPGPIEQPFVANVDYQDFDFNFNSNSRSSDDSLYNSLNLNSSSKSRSTKSSRSKVNSKVKSKEKTNIFISKERAKPKRNSDDFIDFEIPGRGQAQQGPQQVPQWNPQGPQVPQGTQGYNPSGPQQQPQQPGPKIVNTLKDQLLNKLHKQGQPQGPQGNYNPSGPQGNYNPSGPQAQQQQQQQQQQQKPNVHFQGQPQAQGPGPQGPQGPKKHFSNVKQMPMADAQTQIDNQLPVKNNVKPLILVPASSSDFIYQEAKESRGLTFKQETYFHRILKDKPEKVLQEAYNHDLAEEAKTRKVAPINNPYGYQNQNQYNNNINNQYNNYKPDYILTPDLLVNLVRERPSLLKVLTEFGFFHTDVTRIFYNAVRAVIKIYKESGKAVRSPLSNLFDKYDFLSLKPLILFTVKNIGISIRDFDAKYQTDDIQLAAVSQNAKAIEYIFNPTDEVIWTVIKKDPLLIKFIRVDLLKPRMIDYCIKTNGLCIQYINGITERQKIIALHSKIESIRFIYYQNDAIQLIFLKIVNKKNYHLIRSLTNPSYVVQHKIIELAPVNLPLIQKPDWRIVAEVLSQLKKLGNFSISWYQWLLYKGGITYFNKIQDADLTIKQYISNIISDEIQKGKQSLEELILNAKVKFEEQENRQNNGNNWNNGNNNNGNNNNKPNGNNNNGGNNGGPKKSNNKGPKKSNTKGPKFQDIPAYKKFKSEPKFPAGKY